jgi:hypothetical protein
MIAVVQESASYPMANVCAMLVALVKAVRTDHAQVWSQANFIVSMTIMCALEVEAAVMGKQGNVNARVTTKVWAANWRDA